MKIIKTSLRLLLLVLLCTYSGSFVYAQNKGPVPYKGAESLQKTRIAVVTGTSQDAYVSTQFPLSNILRVDNMVDMFVAMENGKADFAVMDIGIAIEVLKTKTKAKTKTRLSIVDSCLMAVPVAVAFRKADAELQHKFNAFLREIKQNGVHDQMNKHWMEAAPVAVPALKRPTQGTRRLVVATNSGTFPFGYIVRGELTGYDVELMTRFALKEGYAIEFLDMNFASHICALMAGKVDAIAAGLNITEERKKQVLFSDSYSSTPSAVVGMKPHEAGTFVIPPVTASDPAQGATLADTIRTVVGDKCVAVVEGSVQELFISETLPASQVSMAHDHPDAFLMVQSGNAGYTLCNIGVAQTYLKKDSTLQVCIQKILRNQCSFGVNKKNKTLLKELNDYITQLRGEGMLDEIYDRWFEQLDEGKMPPIKMNGTKGVLRVGSSCTFIPFNFIAEGEYRGIDIEILSRFAQATGRRIEVQEIPFGSLVASLASGKVDVIANSLVATEERKKAADFTEPYAPNYSVLLGVGQPDSAGAQKSSWLTAVKEAFVNNLIAEKRYMLVLHGLGETLKLSLVSLLLGTIIGAGVCFLRMRKSRFWSGLARIYVDLMRGIPVLVLLMINYYVILADTPLNATMVASLSFAMNFGAYVSEMFRSAIAGIDRGQYEAGVAMGFTPFKTFVHIIAPQAIARVMPIYKGEAISLIKMTSIVGYIAVQDLTKVSDIIRSRTFDAFFPLVLVAVIYFLLAWGFSKLLDLLTSKIIRK